MINAITDSITAIEIFNNVIQFLAIMVSVIITLTIVPWLPIIHKTIDRLGFRAIHKIKILWITRNGRSLLLRRFIELAIIRSQGAYAGRETWNSIINEFTTMIRKDNFTITVENSFSVAGQKLHDAIYAYFRFLENPRQARRYRVNPNEPLSFANPICISEGFLYPAILLSGLQDRFCDDWKSIIDYYEQSLRHCEDNEKISSELSFTYAWLMWGPSWRPGAGSNSYTLAQYAYGDENNSICVSVPGDNNPFCQDGASAGQTDGICCSFCGKLYYTKQYVKAHKPRFGDDYVYQLDKMCDAERGTCFLLEYERHIPFSAERMLNYYCTAYVWLMLERNPHENDVLKLENCIAFFEHANLASPAHVDFLEDRLVAKTVEHLKSVFSSEALAKNTYRFCIAYSDSVREKFRKAVEALRTDGELQVAEAFGSRVFLGSIRTPRSVFRVLDLMLSDEEEIIEVRKDDPQSIAALCLFYAQLFLGAFEDPDERESLDNMLSSLDSDRHGNHYHILIIKRNDQVIGGAIFDYLHKPNCGVIEYIVTDPNYRRTGIASRLYNEVKRVLMSDAKRHQKELDFVIAEIDTLKKSANAVHRPYAYFWESMGFRALDFAYIQPALQPDKQPVSALTLIACPEKDADSITGGQLMDFLREYADFAMRIEKPNADPSIKAMRERLAPTDSVRLKSILKM